MNRLYFILLLTLLMAFKMAASSPITEATQEYRQVLSQSDTVLEVQSAKPIIRTYVADDDQGSGELSTRDKWITGLLAAFGFIGVLVMRLLRKKKVRNSKTK